MGVYVWAWVHKYGWVTGCKCRCGVVGCVCGRVWLGVVWCVNLGVAGHGVGVLQQEMVFPKPVWGRPKCIHPSCWISDTI